MQVAFYFAGEITQVSDAIPWVRCASGNVFLLCVDQSIDLSSQIGNLFIITVIGANVIYLNWQRSPLRLSQKASVEKSKTNAANVIIPHLMQEL